MNASPCKDCEFRRPGCHGDCEVYKAWCAARKEERTQTDLNNAALNMMYSYGGMKWRKVK